MQLQGKHVLVIAGWLASLGTMVAALPDWAAATTPLFVGGAIGSFAVQVVGLYTERPNERAQRMGRR